ncbi:MAG: hypothetical protein IKC31_07065 [Clostridia bacterium]|nr:hypothetical protein [Clostridia bacterium]MBR2927320.1 hypothetical protein [Clostridia bacterium]
MKKNVIGHMTAPKESIGRKIHRMGILPFLVCLIVAFVLWLAVYDVRKDRGEIPSAELEGIRIEETV